MSRSRAKLSVVSAERGRGHRGPSDEIDWDEAFNRRGIGWFCGYVYPLAVVPPGMSQDDIAAMPACGRWHDTRELREACDHGMPPITDMDQDAHEAVPGSPVPIETTGRVNRWDGSCLWCGTTVLAGCGQLVDIDGLLRPVHLDGDCA